MSRVWTELAGPIGGDFVSGNPFNVARANYTRWSLAMLALLGECNVPAGGSESLGIDASATGDKKLLDWAALYFDNTSLQWSDTDATLVAQYRFFLRVSNAAINITPKIWYAATPALLISAPVAATISGEAACSATNSDYSGTNQIQTVTFTLPTGAKYWAAGFTIAGVVAAGYQAWARAVRDIYISSTP